MTESTTTATNYYNRAPPGGTPAAAGVNLADLGVHPAYPKPFRSAIPPNQIGHGATQMKNRRVSGKKI